ncbi:MAG: alpha/beta hydrolase [Solirubrobacteraceae bacterium]|nr:alpha/beta hydrolase [Solirubrobacteraceae bacterium]
MTTESRDDPSTTPSGPTAAAGSAGATTAAGKATTDDALLGLEHHLVPSPAGRTHVVTLGSGPLVVLVHGFPESWYSWRRQLPVLAEAGFRVAAIDVRGYGRSSKPESVEAYRMAELVADCVAVVEALGESTATIIGHDWGSPIAAHAALLEPSVFTAVGLLSVPFAPRGGPRPTELFAKVGGDDHEFYVSSFQEPGRAEAAIEPDLRGWLRGIYCALTPGHEKPGGSHPFFIAKGTDMRDAFPGDEVPLPDWLSEDDLDRYAAEFERTGLTGGLNRYRNMDRDWEDLENLTGVPITQPSLFIGGGADASTTFMQGAIDAYPETLPGLHGSHILEGAGHWIQQERADEVNALLLDWLASLR